MSFLGVDIGTTGCKGSVFDESGKVLTSAYQEYCTSSPRAGWFELDCREVIAKCKEVISECANTVKDTDNIVSLSVSSQGEAFTLLDKRGEYLCRAMVSFDTRSQKQVEEFSKSFGLERLYNITGHCPHTLFSLFKILWLKENEPELIGKAEKLLCFGDLLGYELTGNAALGYSLAARTMLFDVSKLRWSDTILEAIGLDRKVLAEPVPAGMPIGKIRKKIAVELGLSPSVIVAAGGHDQVCGALGAGVTGAGVAAYATGTVECLTPVFSELILNETMRESNLATYPYAIEGFYTTVAFNLTGGSLLRWFRDQFGRFEAEEAERKRCDVYELILEEVPSEPTSLFVQPHFTSTGTPYFDPHPTGAIIGLNLNTTKGEIVRAILEGITYEMKLNVELLKRAGIEINELRATGGGAKSTKWMQIKSDIMDIPIVSLDVSETGCLGAALLAAKAYGHNDSLEQTSKQWVHQTRTYEPSGENVIKYRERFGIYSQIYKTLKPLGNLINGL